MDVTGLSKDLLTSEIAVPRQPSKKSLGRVDTKKSANCSSSLFPVAIAKGGTLLFGDIAYTIDERNETRRKVTPLPLAVN